MPLGNVFGDRYIGNANAVHPGNTEAQEASQAPTQWYEHTDVLESLKACMPQIETDQLPVGDQSTLPNTSMISPCYSHVNEFTDLSGDLTIGQFGETDTSAMATHPPAHTHTADTTVQGILLAPGPMSFSSIGTATPVDSLNDSYNFIPQSTNDQDNVPRIGLDSAWQLYPDFSPDAALASSLNGAPLDTTSEFTQRNVLNNVVVQDPNLESGGNESGARQAYRSAIAGQKNKFKEGNTKVVKIFACFHDGCPFTASSRKDVQRHLHSDKHRKDTEHDRSYCEVPTCKFANEGFSRRDNLLRHMSTMHHIELDREKRGRKRSREE
ncbi:hypothetical protein EKO27_g10351 [Xylaria grammica]|uniref:C2H2-type domain-containing protein n=1 Tax=Xylaria grammica TaxID=363999 RepID=A0A439CRM8_9PEZI|nr:hypothetical protein EKO27_g10351 [Xylaria grammica]